MAREALRAGRERRGETREDTAEALRVSVITIGRWERGDNEVSVAYRRPLARHFEVTLEELEGWLHPACQACERSHAPPVRFPDPRPDVSEDEGMRRREVLRAALAGSGVVLAAPMLTAASRLPGTLADGDLDDLEAAIDGYGRAYPIEPPAVLLPAVVADFGDVAQRRAARDTKALASASARLAGLAGGLLNNLACEYEARGWLAKAAADAEASQDRMTVDWVRTRAMMWPLHHGKQQRVIEGIGEPSGVTYSAGILALLKARAYADLGHPREALVSVGHAERAVRGSGSNVFNLSEAAFCWWAGAVFARIGALNEAEWVRRAYPGTRSARDQAEFDLDMAICLAHAGEPEPAAELASTTLHGLPIGQRTSYVTADAAGLASMLSGCDAPSVREFVGTFARGVYPVGQ